MLLKKKKKCPLSCCKFLCSVKLRLLSPCLQLHNFKRHLAQLIGDLDDSVAAKEDVIISRVKNISRDYRDVKAVSIVSLYTSIVTKV